MKTRRFARLGLLATLAAAGGCTTYYKITDPASKNEYFTTKYDQERQGAIKFNDDKTGRTVTLQNSEISKVSEATYHENVPKK